MTFVQKMRKNVFLKLFNSAFKWIGQYRNKIVLVHAQSFKTFVSISHTEMLQLCLPVGLVLDHPAMIGITFLHLACHLVHIHQDMSDINLILVCQDQLWSVVIPVQCSAPDLAVGRQSSI